MRQSANWVARTDLANQVGGESKPPVHPMKVSKVHYPIGLARESGFFIVTEGPSLKQTLKIFGQVRIKRQCLTGDGV